MKKATSQDVAELAGVSQATVSLLGNDDPHGDEQDHGVEQRNEHRALLIAVGIPGRSMGLCKAESQHGQQQARHVGKVVPGI